MNNSMKITITGLAVTSAISIPLQADAMSNQRMEVVGTSTLNILSIQDQQKTVEKISKGTVVTVIKEMEKQKGWYYVQTPSGKKGVCSGLYLKNIQSQSQSNSGQNTYYAKANLNLRKGAGTSYMVLKTIPAGEKVTKISVSGGWAKVTYGSLTGYCSDAYLTKSNTSSNTSQQSSATTKTTYYSNTDSLNIRTGPSTAYKVYKKINKGTLVSVTKNRNDGWSEISMDGKTYYASSQYLSKNAVSNPNNSSVTKYVNTNTLNVRTQPNTSSPIYKKITLGTAVNVVEKRNDGWSKIKMDNKDVYASSNYLSETKPSANTSTTYSYSYMATTPTSKSSANSIKNVQNAFKKIDGKIVQPGQTFYYLKAIGPVTKANGFVESGVISNGQYSTGVGGGICQGSTTLHNAVIKAGLTVVERRNHSLPSKYISKGLDAMVTGNLDYGFKNTSKYPVKIRAYVSGGNVVVKLESTGDTTNGYKFVPEVTVSPDGLRATTNVVKIKDGKKYPHQTFYSSYRSA